jgi:putative flavoprotein involved in K+ transport
VDTQRDAEERIDTIVIGAGQAGLSTGYHLARRGLPFAILDADRRIGDHWRERWDSLRLYSPARYDALPGMRFPAPSSHWPTGREMADYLEAYANRFDLPVRSGTQVDRVEPEDDGFIVSTADGRRLASRQVIVATGPFRRPYVPPFADDLDPSIRQLHSHDYRDPDQLLEGPVLVVGLSHSGADIAFEAANAGHRTILSGRAHGQLPIRVTDSRRAMVGWPVVAFVFAHVLTVRTPMGRRMRPEVRKSGGPLIRIRLGDLDRAGIERHDARTVGVRNGRPELADGSVLDVMNVIWATGYRPDYGFIAAPIVGEDGWPIEERGVSPTVPGLYFVGVPFQYAFSSMLVAGAGRDAGAVVERVARRARAREGLGRMAPASAAR